LYGVQEAGKLYGFTTENISSNQIRLKYKLGDVTYYAAATIRNEHADLDVFQNFECFIFNKDKSVKLNFIDKTPTVQENLKLVEAGQIKKLAKDKKIITTSSYDLLIIINGKQIQGNVVATSSWPTNGPYFELHYKFNNKEYTGRFVLNGSSPSYSKMPYLEDHAKLFGYTVEKIDNKTRLKYDLNGEIYYVDLSPVDGEFNMTEVNNFVAFILDKDPTITVTRFDDNSKVVPKMD
jgi:hypothetical protein